MTTPKPIHPERKKRVATALRYYSIAAWVTGVWLLVLVVRMILDYGFKVEIPDWAMYIGPTHGLFYGLYLVSVFNLGPKARWQPMKWLATALWGTVPFMSFVIEAKRRKEIIKEFGLDD